MDRQLLAKPLKNFIHKSKEFRNNRCHSVQYCAISKKAVIQMAENNENLDERNVLNQPNNKYIKFNIHNANANELKSEDNQDNLQYFTVKIVDQVDKEQVKYIDITNKDIVNSKSKSPQTIKVKVKIIKEFSDNNTKNSPQLNENTENKDTNMSYKQCIFDENESRPLSPIPVIPFGKRINDLIELHEDHFQNIVNKTLPPKSLPKMGTQAFKRSITPTAKRSDSEIIKELVQDRFVVNLYDSRCRSYRRTMKKRSTFGRIYRSLERTLGIEPEDFDHKISTNQNNEDKSVNDQYYSSPTSSTPNVSVENLHENSLHFQTNTVQFDAVNIASVEIKNQESKIEETAIETNNISQNISVLFDQNANNNNIVAYTSTHKENKYRTEDAVNIASVEIKNQDSKIEETAIETYNISQNISVLLDQNANNDNIEENKYKTEEINMDEIIPVLNSNHNEFCNRDTTDALSCDIEDFLQEDDARPSSSNQNQSMDCTLKLESEINEASSYDCEEFLRKALGDELNKYSNFDSTAEEINSFLHDKSICTSEASDLISKISTFRSSFRDTIKKKLNRMKYTLKHPSTPKFDIIDNDLKVLFPNKANLNHLFEEARAQLEAMKQLSKALVMCHNVKEFSGSPEELEAERLLLVATHKRKAILTEIHRIDYQIEAASPLSSIEKGSVIISAISLPLKNDTNTENKLATLIRDYSKWYVCIFVYGLRVVATEPALATPDGCVRFSENVIFTDLTTDFTIEMIVYCFTQKQNARIYSFASKYHIDKGYKKSQCPTPKKLFHMHQQKNTISDNSDIRASSFKQCGYLKLRVTDLSKPGPWYLRKVSLCSVLCGSVNLQLKSTVRIAAVKQSGFLTVGIETKSADCGDYINWNRRWCVLSGQLFQYWNYPSEEDSSAPLYEINLKNCTNTKIAAAERVLCARPKTLLIETGRPLTSADKSRVFLSADNLSDLKIWETQFNIVINILRTWNVSVL